MLPNALLIAGMAGLALLLVVCSTVLLWQRAQRRARRRERHRAAVRGVGTRRDWGD